MRGPQVLYQSALTQDPDVKKPINFNNLDILYSYVQRVSDNKISPYIPSVEHGSKKLLDFHLNKPSLYVDKHFLSVYPDTQLEYLLESQGIFDYSAYLCQDKEYYHFVCTNEKEISELFKPHLVGDHWNPFLRYISSSKSGAQQCSKLMDLAGSHIEKDENFNSIIFNEIILTFPYEISSLLFNEVNRSRAQYKRTKNNKRSSQKDIKSYNIIDRAHECNKLFFDKLHELLHIDFNKLLGCCSRLHYWISDFPFMPHLHFHNMLPHFAYSNIDKELRSEINEFVLDPIADQYADCIGSMIISGNTKPMHHKPYMKTGIEDNRSSIEGINYLSPKKEKLEVRYIIDHDRYKDFRKELSNELGVVLGFQSLDWFGSAPKKNSHTMVELPLNHEDIKELWSSIVYDKFSDILGPRNEAVLDVHLSFIKASHKSELLHALQYATRPPVVDLDKFFKECPGFITDHQSLNLNAVHEFLRAGFLNAVKYEDVSEASKYESLLQKFEKLKDLHSPADFYSWLQWLSTIDTETKTMGFWRNIKRYMLDPEHKYLIEKMMCPICGGSFDFIRYISNPVIDAMIIRSKSNFLIYDLDGG